MNIQSLEDKVNIFSDKLRKSGKVDVATFYERKLHEIKVSDDMVEKKEALNQIVTSGKLAEMANFSYEEDQLFDLVYSEAKRLL